MLFFYIFEIVQIFLPATFTSTIRYDTMRYDYINVRSKADK